MADSGGHFIVGTIRFGRDCESARVISYCVLLYFRFSVSYRDIEELMAKRGVH